MPRSLASLPWRLLTAALLAGALLAAWPTFSRAQDEVIPDPPTRFFNDYALATRPDTQATLNARLEQFERDTSNQFLVCIYPKMRSPSSIEDYTGRVARAWRVGTKARENGVILFVFLESHRLRFEVGRGLEGPLPDALCGRIIRESIAPQAKAGDLDAGLSAGVDAVIAAAKGEYQGTGQTVADARRRPGRSGGLPGGFILLLMIGFVLFSVISARRQRRRGVLFDSGGSRGMGGGPIFVPFGGGFGGGGGGGGGFGGGGDGGGGGGFESGGGDFGGGGASGDW